MFLNHVLHIQILDIVHRAWLELRQEVVQHSYVSVHVGGRFHE